MSELQRRPGSRPSRRQREQRAFRLVVASGLLGGLAVIGFVLAIVGVIGGFWPVVLAVLAVVCAVILRRTLRP